MEKKPQDETLQETLGRHIALLEQPEPFQQADRFYEFRLRNQVAGLQIDLLRFHALNTQAMLLVERLRAACDELVTTVPDLRSRLLALLGLAAQASVT